MLRAISDSTTKLLGKLSIHVFRLRNRILNLPDWTRDWFPRVLQEETEAAYIGTKEYDSKKDGEYEEDDTEYM